jgi:6-phosphogluconolactonase
VDSISKAEEVIPGLWACVDAEEVAARAAGLFISLATQAVAARGYFRAALSGGSTPQRTYELLASVSRSLKVPWKNVEIFWSDERYVSPDDAGSNFRMTREALLDHVPLPAANIYPVPTQLHPPPEAAAAYEKSIRRAFAEEHGIPCFDLIFLGLGTNGHTASLFPGSPLVQEADRLVAADFVGELKAWRITMTAPLLNRGRSIAFLVTGRQKAEVLRNVVKGPYLPETFPAQLIRPAAGNLLWIADREAASLIGR